MPHFRRTTRNLIVRPLTKSDYEVWKHCFETMLIQQNPWDLTRRKPSELTKAAFKKVLTERSKNIKMDSYYDVGVFEKKSGALVGGVAVMNVVRSVSQSAFLGYWLNSLYWGRGYGKESVLAMIDIAFKDIKLHRVEAGIEPRNRRSIMLARSIGLRKEGLKKRALYLRNEWQDLVMYSATCEDFGVKYKGEIKHSKR